MRAKEFILKEFAPGGGESGRWYTDDQMTDIVGDGWWQDMDVSGANIGVIDSEVPKEYMIQQAQAWLDDQGYSVQVLNCRVNDDDMDWFIEGSFHNPGFAKKGVAEGSENNNPIANKIFFARSNKTPKGWSYDHVGFITQDGKQIQMSGHKGNDVYVTNDVTDDPEFPKQNIKIVSLSKPVSVPTTNSVGAENCGTFVANVLQANGIKDIDTQKIYSVFKKPQEQGVAEGDGNPNQQIALYNPDGRTYRGSYNKMPTLDPNDPGHQSSGYRVDPNQSYETDFDKEDLKRVVARGMSGLSDSDKHILKLRFWDDLTYNEIAAKLGIPREQVKRLEGAALRKLKDPKISDTLRSFSQVPGLAETTGDKRFDSMMDRLTGGAGARQGVDNLNKSLTARTGSDPETALAKWGQEFIKWLEDICRNMARQGVDKFSKFEKLSEFEDGGETMAHWLIEVAKQTKTAGITLTDIQEFSSEFNTHGMWAWQQFPIAWSQSEWQDYKDQWTGPDGYIAKMKKGMAEGVPQPGKSSGKPISWIDPNKVVTKYLTLDEIFNSVSGIPYYNNVVTDRDNKDFTWGVTKRVIQYAKELVIRPDAYKNWPPIIVLDGKLQDGAHRISTIYLMQQRVQPNNPIWKNAKLKVEFGSKNNVKQDVAEGLNEFAMSDGDNGEDPTDNYPCYDCGSTIFLHHTKLCDLAEPNAKHDLPARPGSQHWTGEIPKGLNPIPGLQENVAENFADGRHPEDKGDSRRHGINTKASVSSLRKTAKHSSGRKQELAHWLANMKAGRAKANKK